MSVTSQIALLDTDRWMDVKDTLLDLFEPNNHENYLY